MRYYIADCHFGHDKARVLDGRPFGSVEEMDQVMIERWNEVVQKNRDEVVILGDFSCGTGEYTNEILRQLKGKKYLVRGNHDKRFLQDKKFRRDLLGWVESYAQVRDNNRKVVMSHYPMICYNGQYQGNSTYMLYGHVHNTLDYHNVNRFVNESRESWINKKVGNLPCNLINCFAGFSDYRPLTLDQWIEKDEKNRHIDECE